MNNKKNAWLLLLMLVIIILIIYYLHIKVPEQTKLSNIILISIDTCRADYLSCYGYDDKTTPNIDVLAKTATLFENAISPIPQTLPAHCSMLTGKNPLVLGIHENLGYKLNDSNLTLAEILKEQGYITAAAIGSFVLDSQFGLAQGFDTYNDEFQNTINTSNYSERPGQEVTDFAISWLDKNKENKFFLFLHYYDPHFRYSPPEPFSDKFKEDLYAGEIAYVDHCIGQVIDKLKSLDLYNSSMIIVTSDHGEMLGEHGEAEHGYFIYQSAIKVPFVVKMPDQTQARKIDKLVGIIDIVPTISGLLGFEYKQEVQGYDISNYLTEKQLSDENRYIYCESLMPTKHNANPLFGMVSDQWKYIETTRSELYDLIADPSEKNNLIDRETKVAHLLSEHLKLSLEEQSRDETNSEYQLDEEGRKRLESLGYISSIQVDDSILIDENKPDPKDFIKFHNIKAYNEMAIGLAKQGKLDEAVIAFKMIIKHYETAQIQHSMANLHVSLSTVLNMQKKTQEALQHMNKALSLYRAEVNANPESAITILPLIGDVLASMGNLNEASEVFKRALALQRNTKNFENLARSLEYQGLYDEALTVLQAWREYEQTHGNDELVGILIKEMERLRFKSS